MTQPDDFAERLQFYDLNQLDRPALKGVEKALRRGIDTALHRFYDKVGSTAQVGHFFRDRSHMDHAKQAQRNHWLRAFSTGPDSAFRKRAEIIGETHPRTDHLASRRAGLAPLPAVASQPRSPDDRSGEDIHARHGPRSQRLFRSLWTADPHRGRPVGRRLAKAG